MNPNGLMARYREFMRQLYLNNPMLYEDKKSIFRKIEVPIPGSSDMSRLEDTPYLKYLVDDTGLNTYGPYEHGGYRWEIPENIDPNKSIWTITEELTIEPIKERYGLPEKE